MANKDELEKERKEDPTVAVKTVVKGADGNVIEITKDTTAIETEISAKEKEKVQAKIAKLSRQAPGMKEKTEETMKVIDETKPEDFSSEEVKFENVTAQQEQEAIRAKRDYTADDIKVLKVKDYIKNPKPSGYRSYHMVVEIPVFFSKGKTPMKVELQIRTNGMDFWATLEHQLRYKKGIEEIPGYDQISAQLQHCAQAVMDADTEMQKMKNQIGHFNEI